MHIYRSISFAEALGSPLGQTMRGDGPPHWLESRHNNPPISAPEARRQRRVLLKALKASTRYVENPAEAAREATLAWHTEDFAHRLATCAITAPCGSGACPVCWRAMRRIMIHASRHQFRKPGRHCFVTCISAADRVVHHELHAADPLAAVESRIMGIAVRSRVRVFGGIDISSNEHRQNRFRPHFSPHGHLIVPADGYDETAWGQQFPIDPLLAPKPLMDKPFNGKRRLIAYCLHPIVERRDSEAAHIAADGTWVRANTRDKPLRLPQRVELALMLDRVGIEARIITHGYDLRTDGDDIWMVEVCRQRAEELLAERRERRAARRMAFFNRERDHAMEQRKLFEL